MPLIFRKNIQKGTRPIKHGHMLYPDAFFSGSRIIYKKNKHKSAQISAYECMFGQLMRLMVNDQAVVPDEYLVATEATTKVKGIACEYIYEAIAKHMPTWQSSKFFTYEAKRPELFTTSITPKEKEEIPFYFLHTLGHTFFKDIREKEAKGELLINKKSLSRILAASYFLEEDDLHKGNIGIYITEENNLPYVHFSKIDHDMMMAAEITSHINVRALHWRYNKNAFRVRANDLVNFPDINDSGSYYWPTIKRTLVNKYAYKSSTERNAFKSLKDDPEFIKEKWLTFANIITMPAKEISKSLEDKLNTSAFAEDINLVTQAVVARQAELRAILFTINEFRDFFQKLEPDAVNPLCKDKLVEYQQLQKNIKKGDTPLHVAIKLDEYRYQETMEYFGKYKKTQNEEGKYPIDLLTSTEEHECIKAHLADGEKSDKYIYANPYLAKLNGVRDFAGIKSLITEIASDHKLCLKTQKQITVKVIKAFISQQKHDLESLKPIVTKLKDDLNQRPWGGYFRFVCQLRSKLWIVRMVRGLFGHTSTKHELNNIFKDTLSLKPDAYSPNPAG